MMPSMNRRRPTTGLVPDKVFDMIEAASFAWGQGWTPMRFITIRLAEPNERLPDGVAQKRVRDFLKHAGDWMRYHGASLVYVWVIEDNPRPHVHILVHCPAHLRAGWAILQRSWMKAAGIPWAKAAIKTDPNVRSIDQLKGVLRYMAKGLEDEDWRKALGIEWRGSQGVVIGRRRSISENIGATARQRYYSDARELPQGLAIAA
jgi:hypothetical protein